MTMTPFRSSLLCLISLSLSQQVHGGVLQLTAENFESATEGKNVFIKFFAPWCGHCRSMEEDWQHLATDFEGHEVALIAEVDCTSDEGQPVCEDFEVQGFPTLVFGDPLSGETYDGPRDYESLSEFAKESIAKPICSIFRVDNCSDEDTKIIKDLEGKTEEELDSLVKLVEGLVKSQEDMFDDKVEEIQSQYDAMVAEFNSNLEGVKEKYNYKFVEQLINIRGGGDEGEEGDEEEEEYESEL